MAVSGIFNALLVLVADLGIYNSIIQAKDPSPEQVRKLFGIVVISNAVAGILMAVIIAPLAAAFFGDERLTAVIQVIALQFLPAAFSVVPSALLAREMRFRARAITDFVANVSGGIITVLLALTDYGVFSLAWGGVGLAVVRMLMLNYTAPHPGLPLFSFTGCGEMFHFGRYVAQSQLTWFFYSQADSFIIGKVLGKHLLGIYSVSMDLASIPATRISAILYQVVGPTLAKIHREGGKVGWYIVKGVSGLCLASFPVMWGISSVAPEFVQAVLGEKWLEATVPLSILCFIMPLRVASPLIHSALNSVGRADVSFRLTWITALLMCSAYLVGAQFGLQGVALAWAIMYPTVFMYNLVGAQKHIGIGWTQITAAMARPAFVSALMYAAIALMRPFLPWTALINMAVLITTGIVAYVGFSFIFNRKGINEARDLLKRR